jgi:hypothetical protein
MSENVVVYVAGPLSAEDNIGYINNVHNNIKLATKVRELGCIPFIPSLDFLSVVVEGSIDLDTVRNESLEMMLRCDMVIFDSGWQDSEGCKNEFLEAIKYGMPIFTNIDLLSEYLDDKRKQKIRESNYD